MAPEPPGGRLGDLPTPTHALPRTFLISAFRPSSYRPIQRCQTVFDHHRAVTRRSATSDLVVRGSDRYQCDIPVSLTVAPAHARMIKPDKSAPGAGGPVECRIVDLSSGGAGVRSPLFLPQGARL